jgi:hypothetical protein
MAPEGDGVGHGAEIPVVSNTKTIQAHAALLTKNIPSPLFADRQYNLKPEAPGLAVPRGRTLGQALTNSFWSTGSASEKTGNSARAR